MKKSLNLPCYTGDQLWVELTTDKLGFYTSRTSSSIPSSSGIYAWFLPLELKDESASSFIERYKTMFSYDSKKKGVFFEENDLHFQWQNFQLSLEAKNSYSSEGTQEESWDSLQNSLASPELKGFRQMLLLGSIFTKPLYVGLTNNLSNRYEQHSIDTKKNSFNKRFRDFSAEKSLELGVSDLLFVCISLPDEADEDIMKKELNVLEYFLKNISGPIFGEK